METIDYVSGIRRPLTVEEIEKMRISLTKSETSMSTSGLLPENILFANQIMNQLVWYTKPVYRKVNHTIDEWPVECYFYWPSLVMKIDDDSLYVMAYDGEDRPNIKTQLYSLDLPNYNNNNGWNCLRSRKFSDVESLIKFRTEQFYTWKFNSSWNDENDQILKGYIEKNEPSNFLKKSCLLKKFIDII